MMPHPSHRFDFSFFRIVFRQMRHSMGRLKADSINACWRMEAADVEGTLSSRCKSFPWNRFTSVSDYFRRLFEGVELTIKSKVVCRARGSELKKPFLPKLPSSDDELAWQGSDCSKLRFRGL